jgi:hypothetical protein
VLVQVLVTESAIERLNVGVLAQLFWFDLALCHTLVACSDRRVLCSKFFDVFVVYSTISYCALDDIDLNGLALGM